MVDVVEGPAPIYHVRLQPVQTTDDQGRASFQFAETDERLCAASPCAANLAPGNVLLGFPVTGKAGEIETDLVHIGPSPSVYRRSLSAYEGSSSSLSVLGIIAASLGASAAITGTVLLPIGLSQDRASLTTAGGLSLGAGAAVLALGIWAIWHDAPTYRPGSAVHFSLPSP